MRDYYFFLCGILFLLIDSQSSFAQEVQNTDTVFTSGCGTVLEPGEYKLDKFSGIDNQVYVDMLLEHGVAIDKNYLNKLENEDAMTRMNPQMFGLTGFTYQIPVKVWVYRNNNGTGNISLTQVRQVIDELNELYSSQTSIHFYLLCNISVVNNTNYASQGDTYFNTYINNNRVSGAINLHFVINSDSWGGRAVFPWDSDNFSAAIVASSNIQGTANTVGHEIGHTLGLYHTHESARSSHVYNEDAGNCYQESVSRTRTQGAACVSTIGARKCAVNGDQLCDTEADPGLYRASRGLDTYYVDNGFNCNYQTSEGGTDNWGSTWTPEVANIMGYAYRTCRSYFSPMQVAKMYGYIDDIGISHPSFYITGPNYVCTGQSGTLSVPALAGVTYYDWETPSGLQITSGQGTNSITVQATGSYSGDITVTPNCGGPIASRGTPNPANTYISGEAVVCPDERLIYTYEVTPSLPSDNYSWTVHYGQILSGQNDYQVVVYFEPSQQDYSELFVDIQRCGSTLSLSKYLPHDPACIDNLAQKSDSTAMKTPVGEADGEVMDMNLYPNPAVDRSVTITTPDNGVYDLVLFDFNYQMVFRENRCVQKEYTLDISSYQPGMYFVYLISQERTYSKKLIIQK